MGISDVRIGRVLVQVALTTLSLSVIGLCIRAMNDMAENKRLLVSYLPRAQIEANAIVGVGTALVIICIGIIIVAILNSIYILKDRCPQAIRKRCPDSMGIKTMSIFAILLTPINIAQSYLTSSQRARVSAGSLPESVIEQLVELSGRTLQFKEMVVIVDYTVVSWIILILLLLGVAIESSKFSRPEYGDSTKEELSA